MVGEYCRLDEENRSRKRSQSRRSERLHDAEQQTSGALQRITELEGHIAERESVIRRLQHEAEMMRVGQARSDASTSEGVGQLQAALAQARGLIEQLTSETWQLESAAHDLAARMSQAAQTAQAAEARALEAETLARATAQKSQEIEETARREISRRESSVQVLQTDLDAQREELRARGVDAVVCLDVLEHIQDDLSLLRSFAGILPAGGTLFIKVPAHQWLFGSVDVASDHLRRYSRADLVARVEEAGFQVRAARYMNLAGVGPYLLKSRILRRGSTFSIPYPSQHWS